MNFNRVIQPQVGVISTNNYISQSPIKYTVVSQQIAPQPAPQNVYYVQNGGGVQSFFTPIKSADARNIPQVNVNTLSSAASTSQLSPFQTYNSKQYTATTLKGNYDQNQVNNNNQVNNILFPQSMNNQVVQNTSILPKGQPNNILDITNQIPLPPKNNHQSKRIFDDRSQKSHSQAQRQNYRVNQSSFTEHNDSSVGSFSHKGNLRNSSFVVRTQEDADSSYHLVPQRGVGGQSVVVVGQQLGSALKRNSSYEAINRTYSSKDGYDSVNSNQQQQRRISLFEKKLDGKYQENIQTPTVNIVKQNNSNQGYNIAENNEFERGRINQQRRSGDSSNQNILIANNYRINNITNGNNADKGSSNISHNTSSDQIQIQNQQQLQQQGIYYNKQGTQNSQKIVQKEQNQASNNATDKLKIDFTPQTLMVKYTPKQEIFSFENSQIYIDEQQIETPLAPAVFQNTNFTQNNLVSQQNTDVFNFFSTNQQDTDTLGFPNEREIADEFNSHNHKISLLEVSNNDTQEFNLVNQLAQNSNKNGDRIQSQNDQEGEGEQRLQQPSHTDVSDLKKINELLEENNMLRSNLIEIKELYTNLQINGNRQKALQEENNNLKLQVVQLQLQNQDYEQKLQELEQKQQQHNTSSSQINYNSNNSSNLGDKKSVSALQDQIKELQEKNEIISKEKVTLMGLLLNQEKMYNTLSMDLQKQQASPERSRFSNHSAASQNQGPHPKYVTQLEERVKSYEDSIKELKEELLEKDNLIQQMQFDLKDSQKQLGLFSDQILVLKEKLSQTDIQKEDNQKYTELEKELMVLQTQNQNLMDINTNLSKQNEILERNKKTNTNPQFQQIQQQHVQQFPQHPVQQQKFEEFAQQRVQLSKYFEKNNKESEMKINPSLGGQAYLNLNRQNSNASNNSSGIYNKQNYDKFMNSSNNTAHFNNSSGMNPRYPNIKNQNQILFTNSNKKLITSKDDHSNQHHLSSHHIHQKPEDLYNVQFKNYNN